MSQPQPPRRPTSPWLVGAGVLSTFVALAIFLKDSTLAVQVMIAAVLLALLLMRYPKRGQVPGAVEAAAPSSTAPQQAASNSVRTPVVTDLPAVLTLKQAAEYLQHDPAVVAAELDAGRLPGNQLAGNWRIRRAALDDWLDGTYGTAASSAARQ
jgi:hypothetical protein